MLTETNIATRALAEWRAAQLAAQGFATRVIEDRRASVGPFRIRATLAGRA
ncbi:hypothetical protein EV664_105188 [Stakelama pacifica]|uniref:SPOR domain-containing protein n=2 Tax=Stakelama pacifica TaxID=517720 RepID=A0A4R6FPH0_9SPHN|nr:hypothetical protein EV664_105188 [Stakelama pacifica]GGO94990.1 hypothetical protein GCM10011329_18120 [Stakelama pacifica]